MTHIGHACSVWELSGNLSNSFAFVNALPLPGYTDIPKALQFLNKYLRCVRPIIIASFGKRSSDTVVSGFTKLPIKKSTSNGILETHVEVSLRPYGDGSETVIHIPLSHPGKYQHGRRNASSVRLFYLQLQLVYVIADCAMEVLAQQKQQQPILGKSTRRDVCLTILHHTKIKLQKCCSPIKITENVMKIYLTETTQVTKVSLLRTERGVSHGKLSETILHRLKLIAGEGERQDIPTTGTGQSLLKRKSEAIEKEFTCPIYGQATFDRIMSLGRARGTPHSPERETHLKGLWVQNVPELHLVIPHTPELESRWLDEFMGLQQGQSYFLKLLSKVPGHTYMEALARVCNSIGRHKKRFDAITVRTEVQSGLWVPRKVIQAYRAELSPRVETEDMQGFPVEIKPNGVIKIKWLTQAGIQKTVTIDGLEYAIPQNGFECCSLSFTEHGIDIVDANGGPIRPYEPWEKSPPSATLPRWKFKSKEGQLVQELWEAVRSVLGDNAPADRIKAVPKKRNGIRLIPSNSTTETPKQDRPPNIKDANYLLYHFLIERFQTVVSSALLLVRKVRHRRRISKHLWTSAREKNTLHTRTGQNGWRCLTGLGPLYLSWHLTLAPTGLATRGSLIRLHPIEEDTLQRQYLRLDPAKL